MLTFFLVKSESLTTGAYRRVRLFSIVSQNLKKQEMWKSRDAFDD